MENEKKTPSPQGEHTPHKRHRSRHRGYFIEPKERTDADGKVEAVKKQDSTASKSAEQQKPQQGQNKPSNKPQGQGKPQQTSNPNAPATQGGNAQGGASNNAGSSNHKRRKRNNHKKKPSQTSEGEKSQQTAQNQPNTKAEQPRQANNKGHNEHNRQGKQNQKNNRSDVLVPMPIEPKHTPRIEADDEYEEVMLPSHDEPLDAPVEPNDEPVPMVEVIGIRFKNSGKTYYFAPEGNVAKKGEYAIVETARGREYGEVSMGNTMVKKSDTVPPLRPIIRVATEADRAHHEANKKLEEDAFRVCNEKIAAHGLDMKLIDAQYTFDNSKLLFYFTSDGRVDFRVLVKDLASVFRTRIELRQIGIRDEAKLLGGIGMCGRPLCCSLFLSDFGQVSIKMAKEQNLSLNSAKISGICGRLMCCLRYEHKTYEYEIKRTPPVDSVVRTPDGNGTVTESNPLVGTVKVRLMASPEVAPKIYKREDVVMLQKKKSGNLDAKSNKSNNS